MEDIVPSGYDRNVPFILRYYQILPKYYFFSQTNTNSLICIMNMGTGKTSLSIFMFLEYINKFKKSQFIDSSIEIKNNTYLSNVLIKNPNVYFIGSWNSCFACKTDLLNKAFNFYQNDVLVKLEKLLKSNNPTNVEEGKRYRNFLLRESNKYIKFMGYQALVNMCFPTLFQKLIQNPNILLDQWKENKLDIEPNILKEFKNCFVVIDEIQRLYSSIGLNSYGITVMILHKHAKEYNIKFLFLTGTIINSVLAEITSVANIVSDTKEYIEFDDWTIKEPIKFNANYSNVNSVKDLESNSNTNSESNSNTNSESNSKLNLEKDSEKNSKSDSKVNSKAKSEKNSDNTSEIKIKRNNDKESFKYTIREDKKEEIFKTLCHKLFFYNPSDEARESNPKLKKYSINLINDSKSSSETISKTSTEQEFLMLQFPEKTNYPIECQIGNCIIDSSQMIVMKLKVEGVQAERYAEYLREVSVMDDDNIEDNVNSSILPQDAGLPLKESEYIKNGIVRINNLYYGSFLKLENIRKYSIIAYWMFKLALANALKHEKTIIYHIKLNGFGLYQYGEVLDYNGFVRYESSVKNNSICKNCGHIFKEHAMSLKDKIKNKVCNDFKPIVYAYLTGDVNQTERDDLVNNVYNSAQNANGDIIDIMFVSDVAYSGVSFLNTNNIFILSRIPNISKWRQISARIIRNKSHSLIENKQAKIYTFIVYHENESKISLGEKYYRLRIIYEADSTKFLKELSKKSIGNIILNAPDSYHLDSNAMIRFRELLQIDLKNCLNNVVNEIFKKHSEVWTINNLIERIKSKSNSIAPLNMINLSSDYIIKYIFSSSLHVFKYKNPILGTNEIYVSKNLENTALESFQSISYMQLQSISFEARNLNILIQSLYNPMNNYTKGKIIGEIIKLTYKKLYLLSNCEIFWTANYEIHNEYYEDDNKNFFYNHSEKNRSVAKMAGIYYNDSIIKRDGSRISLKYSFVDCPGFKNMKYIYKITCFVSIMTSPFYLNVIIEPIEKKNVKDLRKIDKALQCVSIPTENIMKDFPKITYDTNKRDFCRKLISVICEYQYKHKDEKGVLSPFEK